jgi:hypothetical protein
MVVGFVAGLLALLFAGVAMVVFVVELWEAGAAGFFAGAACPTATPAARIIVEMVVIAFILSP